MDNKNRIVNQRRKSESSIVIMIRKETVEKMIECFGCLGQDYYYVTDYDIADEKIANPFNSRSEAKAFVKWMAKYFNIDIPSETVLKNSTLEQLKETLSAGIEGNDLDILLKIIGYYGKCWDRVLCLDFKESISDTIRYSHEYLNDEIIEDISEEIYDELRDRMQMPVRLKK